MPELTASDMRALSAIVTAEREIAELTRRAFAGWLPLVVDAVVDDAAIVAAIDPDRASRAQGAWDRAVEPVIAALAALWSRRYNLTGRNDRRRAAELAKFTGQLRERLSAVTGPIYDLVQRVVVDARSNGLPDEQVRAALSQNLQPEGFDAKSEVIARTSVINAYNDGAERGFQELAEATGRPITKTWRAILDDRVRPTHAAANGQEVGVDEFFQVGGFSCSHPGDNVLPAAESLNCRCIATFRIDGIVAGMGTTFTVSRRADGSEWVVVNDDTDEVLGMHSSKARAFAQLRALNRAAEEPVEQPVVAAMVGLPSGWRGPIAALDRLSGDDRWLATPVDGLRTREYPMTVTRKHVTEDEDIFVGTIELAWIQDGLLFAEGSFDLGSDEGREVARLVGERLLFTMSVDLDQVVAEQRLVDEDGNLAPEAVVNEAIETGVVPEGFRPVLVFVDWRLSSTAIVSIPAFDEARIEPVFDYVRPIREPEPIPENFVRVSQDILDTAVATGIRLMTVLEDGVTRYEIAPDVAEAIVASAAMGGQIFHAEFFEFKATGPTPLTVDENGHVYGHVREYGTCYQYGGGQGDGGYCVEPPLSACSYDKFHVHGAKLDNGRILAVGALTYGDGHESRGGLQASIDHYNQVATIAAKVVASEDQWGVWITGEVCSDHADKAYDLLLSPMSGHWEPDSDNNNHLEMLAVHVVCTPGYAVKGNRRIVAGFDGDKNPTFLIVPSPMRARANRDDTKARVAELRDRIGLG